MDLFHADMVLSIGHVLWQITKSGFLTQGSDAKNPVSVALPATLPGNTFSQYGSFPELFNTLDIAPRTWLLRLLRLLEHSALEGQLRGLPCTHLELSRIHCALDGSRIERLSAYGQPGKMY